MRAITFIVFLSFLLSSIIVRSQKTNIKFSVAILPGYHGISVGFERKIFKYSSLHLQSGFYDISVNDYSSFGDKNYTPRTD